MGHLVALVAPKGGLGCTTLALTLTTALRKVHGPKVVLVEGDLMFGDLATMVGLRPDRSILDILDKPRPWSPNIVKSAVIHHPVLDFDVVLAPAEAHLAEKVTPKHFVEFVDTLLVSHDFVVVDMASRFGEQEIEVFDRAKGIYLLTAPDPVAVSSSRKMVKVFQLLKDPIKKLALIANHCPAASEELSQEQIEAGVGVPVVATVPRGKPDELSYQNLRLLEPFSPWGPAQKAICEFARELRGALWTGKEAPGTRSDRVISAQSFNPFVAVAGKDLSNPPGASMAPPSAAAARPPSATGAPDPGRTTQDRMRRTLSERLRVSRTMLQKDMPSEVRDPNAAPPPPAPPAPPPPAPPPVATRTVAPASHTRQHGKVGIIVADDNANFRTGLCRALSFEERLQILAEATDGQEVLDLAVVHNPEVVLMDANMPRLSGLEAAQALKARHPQTRVLMMSVQGEEGFVKQCLASGVDHFLLKPFDPDDVSRLVNQMFPV